MEYHVRLTVGLRWMDGSHLFRGTVNELVGKRGGEILVRYSGLVIGMQECVCVRALLTCILQLLTIVE